MRALRVVGLTEDGEVVLEDPVRLERFRVPADERLRAAARGDLSRLGQIAIELESQLRPREIQARIRAGASVEQVAAAAGVPEQKIERFAYPVLLERFRTAENAQRAHPVRADGPDNRTLGDVVAHTFGLRGQEYEGVRWDSWKGEDGRWVVALGWRAGRSDNRAHWTFQPGAHGGTVTALDEHASDLVEGLPARPLRTVGAVVDMTRPEEEPPPAPSPVEQWRAAASDSYRDRMPLGPEPGRPGAARTPEPWRPAPPAQRQAEPAVDARGSEPRTGSYRGNESRPAADQRDGYRAAAEWTPGDRGVGTQRRETGVPEQGRPEPSRPEPSRQEPARPEQARPEPSRQEPVRQEPARPEQAAQARTGSTRLEEPPRTDSTRPASTREQQAPTESARSAQREPSLPQRDRAETPRPESTEAVPAPEPTSQGGSPADRNGAPAVEPSRGARANDGPAKVGENSAETTTAAVPVPGASAGASAAETPAGVTTAAPGPATPAAAPAVPAASTPAPATPAPTAATPAETGARADAPSTDTAAPAAAPADAPTETPAEAPASSGEASPARRRTKKGKPAMPSWDEVLLGVRGPR